MKTEENKIAVIMGSDSDLPVMQEAVTVLKEFRIPYELLVLSAHRTPEETLNYAQKTFEKGIKIIIAGAGGAAHLPGVMAAFSPLPVIGVPIKTATLNGLDSLFSIVQMPPGVPVATVGINGAKNAAILAAEMLAIEDKSLQKIILDYKRKLAKSVKEKSEKLNQLGVEKYLNFIEKKK